MPRACQHEIIARDKRFSDNVVGKALLILTCLANTISLSNAAHSDLFMSLAGVASSRGSKILHPPRNSHFTSTA